SDSHSHRIWMMNKGRKRIFGGRKEMYKRSVLVLVLFVFFTTLVMGQTAGTISGVVQDSTGAVIRGVSVTVKNVDTGTTRMLVTDEQGRYRGPNLPPGSYEVEAMLAGFQTEIRRGIVLTVGQDAVVNIGLQVGQVADQVEVNAEAAAVEVNNATISGLVNQDTIRDMPLNGRSFTDLIPLQAGTVLTRNNTTSSALGGGAKISISGSRPLTNNFLLD